MAISLVLINHFAPSFTWLDTGTAGVDVFFCLSGFLMSNILFVRRMPLVKFYKRRVSRILPVFLLFVLCAFALAKLRSIPFSKTELLATLVFLRTYIPAVPGIWDTNVPIQHIWSLNVEEHCYVFLGLLTLLPLVRREVWALTTAALGSILVFIVYVKIPRIAPHSSFLGTEVQASYLLFSAAYHLARQHFVALVRPWMPLAALAIGFGCYTQLSPWWSEPLVAPVLFAFSINHLSESPGFFRTILSARPLRMLGIWSYSLYLWQQPFFKFQHGLPVGLPLVLAFLVGIVSFYFFERPIRTWLNRHW
jgi:peptidoglycan/LPS O-acetylase OafA/YrhL